MKDDELLGPVIFVIFGGGGDLTWRKVVPALFDLFREVRTKSFGRARSGMKPIPGL